MSKPVIPKMITNICEYETRNLLIIKILNELLNNKDRKILVLSDRPSVCEPLSRMHSRLSRESHLSLHQPPA